MIANYDKRLGEARGLVVQWLPTFIFTPEFPELQGHQNLEQYINHRGETPALKESEDNFEKLAKVAGFSPKQLHERRDDHEFRSQLLNRAGALVTGEIRRLWKDRPLQVRFNLDGVHLDVLISDPNAYYPIEVNLDERSRGFKWFFSFYIIFSADTQGGKADGAILLLDEPGLFLHAMSQDDLLKHFQTDFKNQIIYTTHSPFMVPATDIASVRTVSISPDTGTAVTTTPTGDSKTLFPLQAALGYHLSQTLFIGHSNLVVEGITDFWILSSVSNHLSGAGLPADLIIMPVGGAGKVSYMAALLASQELHVLVLLDDDRAGRDTHAGLVKSKLLKETAITFVTEGFAKPVPIEADIEDLLEPAIYDALVSDTYKTELKGKTLALNGKIPRIVKRYEDAFSTVGLEFNKTRPAREFITRMSKDPAAVLPQVSANRFTALFKIIATKYGKTKKAAG